MNPESEVIVSYEQCVLDMQLLVYQFVYNCGGWDKLDESHFEKSIYEELDDFLERVEPSFFDADRVLPVVSQLISDRDDHRYDCLLSYIMMNFAPAEYAERYSQEFFTGGYEEEDYDVMSEFRDNTPWCPVCGQQPLVPTAEVCFNCSQIDY